MRLRGLLFTVVAAVLHCSCSSNQDPEGAVEGRKQTLDRIRREGVVRIGYANEAPYAYLDQLSGCVTGEAPEIARVVLKRMGVEKVEGVLTEFGSLIPGLKARRFDIIAAGMYITPARCAQILFSNPTYSVGEAFMVLAGNPLSLHGYEDIAGNPEARLGVVAGTVEREYAKKCGIPDDRILIFPDPMSALAGLRAGRIEAYGGTSLTINDLMSKTTSSDIERANPFSDPIIGGSAIRGYGAFGFRLGEELLVEAFNRELAAFIGTPEHLDLVTPFGFGKEELPGPVTAGDLCGRSARAKSGDAARG